MTETPAPASRYDWGAALRRLEHRAHYLDEFLGELKRREHLRLVRDWGALDPAARLLKTDLFEEAVGPDALLGELDREVGEAHGVDVSPTIVERARRRLGAAGPRCQVADVRALPYADGAFSTVLSTSTLDHFGDPADLGRSLREIRRVLASGGRLVVTLDNRQNLLDPLLRLVSRLGGSPYFLGRSYRVEELRRELAAAGFEVVATTAILHNPRLLAVGAVRLARWSRSPRLVAAVRRLLLAAQRLERTRWRYFTGSFVAALARRPAGAAAIAGAGGPRAKAGALARARWTATAAWRARSEARLPFRPLADVLALQRRRVQSIVRHAYAEVPHYREAMRAAGLLPRELRSAADLALLPRISGDDLAAAPERFASRRFAPPATVALRSSGTGGRPKTVRYSTDALITALAHGQRQRAVFARFVGRRSGYRELVVHRSDSVSDQLRDFYDAHTWLPRRLDLVRARLPIEAGFAETIAGMNDFRPDVVFGYGSHLGPLFRWAHERGRRIHRPRLLWYGADGMADADRALLEQELGIPVVSTYQADEALRLGFQCEERRGFHLCLDDVAVRVVDGAGRDVGPGESGSIVISNLTNRATVLLNYELGDVVTVGASPCPCGRTLPTIERIEGRADDCLHLPGGEIRHPLAVLQKLQGLPGVVRVQLVQEELSHLALRAVCAADCDWPATRDRLAAVLREHVPAAARLEVARVDEIPREPGGKVRGVVSRLARRA